MGELIRKRVVSIDVSIVSYQHALENVMQLAKGRTTSYACFSNVHMVIEAYQ